MALPAQPDSGFVYNVRQYSGFFLIVLVTLVLAFGYGRGYVADGYITGGCLLMSLVALLLHETRPFKRWENITAEVEELRKEQEVEELRRKQD